MTRLVPIGFLTFREAVSKIEDAMFAGAPDAEAVLKARQVYGGDVGDLDASRKAADALWKAVDEGGVRAVGIGKQPFRVMNLPPTILEIPALRRTGDFSYLRARNVAFEEVVRSFGPRPLANITLAFREANVAKLCKKLRGSRRRAVRRSDSTKNVGRPALGPVLRPVIIGLIDGKKWNSSESMKQLTRLVSSKVGRKVSDDSVIRELDKLHAETRERSYARTRRIRRR
jgi:hypothetical protein